MKVSFSVVCNSFRAFNYLTLNLKHTNMKDQYYVIVKFPIAQTMQEETWFEEEAILANSDKAINDFGYSAYLVPLTRYEKFVAKYSRQSSEEE